MTPDLCDCEYRVSACGGVLGTVDLVDAAASAWAAARDDVAEWGVIESRCVTDGRRQHPRDWYAPEVRQLPVSLPPWLISA
jgi:hypothetical protein